MNSILITTFPGPQQYDHRHGEERDARASTELAQRDVRRRVLDGDVSFRAGCVSRLHPRESFFLSLARTLLMFCYRPKKI